MAAEVEAEAEVEVEAEVEAVAVARHTPAAVTCGVSARWST